MTGRVTWTSPWGPIPVDLADGRVAAIYLDPRRAPRRNSHDDRGGDGAPRIRAARSTGSISGPAALQRLLDAALGGSLSAREVLAAVDLRWATPFERAVLRALAHVRRGTTATYGELAATIRSPRAARAVGGALGRNRVPILLPCHRIVAASGIGGYGGGAGARWRPGGADPIAFKRRLLAREGVGG